MSPSKQARGGETAKGIPKAAQSTARDRRKPAVRIPKSSNNDKHKEAGRGAERLTTPSSQGIYRQCLPGPSFQDWAVETTDGTLTWVEGRVDEEVVHHTDSTVQQQDEEVAKQFIPRIFGPEYRSFLKATEADFARGTVQAIKYRVCPETNLKNFKEFKMHCRTTETHPLELHFCGYSGDYFARQDSLKRHWKRPAKGCPIDRSDAEEKRRVTQEEHRAFVQRLEDCLTTGEDIGRSFSQIIKDIYPQSSKKRMKDARCLVRYFVFLSVCFCPVILVLLRHAVLGLRCLGRLPIYFGLECLVVVLASLYIIYILRCLDQP